MIFALLLYLAATAATIAIAQEDASSLATAATRRCFDLVTIWQCEESSYAVDSADISLKCGSAYLPYAENFVAACTKGGENNDYCLNVVDDASTDLDLDGGFTDVGLICESAVDSATCYSNCSDLLQELVDQTGCCFRTVFNERLAQLLLGHDVDISLNACSVQARSACTPPFQLVVPSNPDSCTFDQYWSRITNYVCHKNSTQSQIDALLTDRSLCLPMARHFYNACGRGPDNRYCIDLYGTSFNPSVPTRTIGINADLNNVMTQCANYSQFRTEGCDPSCKGALQTAIENLGCCVNNFNDSVNQVLVPQFGGDVMIACNIESPGVCQNNDLNLEGSDGSVCTAVVALSGLLMPFIALIFFN